MTPVRPEVAMAASGRSSLTVGFDGRALSSPAAGVRRYVSELFAAMAAQGRVELLALGASAGTLPDDRVRAVPAAPTLPTNVGWMLTGLPLTLRRARPVVFHAPAYTAPAQAPCPVVLTVHDVSYARHPEWYPYRRDPARRAFYRWSARSATRIVTDSEFSRAEIAAAYGIELSRIDVVPLAAAHVFAPGPPLPLPPGVGGRYLLHVGDLHARRNVGTVVRALTALKDRRRDLADVTLVLAGVPREANDGASLVDGARAGVRPVGFVDERALLALYRSASALVYPSRYEGFGLPIVEAMACGVPVIASAASCLPEVAGDAAVLCDPDDDGGWADAIEGVLDDAVHAEALRTRGHARAATYSWARTAAETVRVYERAAGLA